MITTIKKIAPLTTAFNVAGLSSDWYYKLRYIIYTINRNIDNINDLQEQNNVEDELIAKLREDLNTLSEQVDSNTERIENLETDVNKLEERMDTAEGNIEDIFKDIENINAEIDEINQKIEDINTEIETIHQKDNEQDEFLEKLDYAIETIKAEQIVQDERLDAVETKNTEQDERLDAIETKNTEQDETLANHEERITTNETNITDLYSKFEDLVMNFTKLLTDFKALEDDLTKRYDALKETLDIQASTIASLQSQITLLNTMYGELLRHFTEIQEEWEKTKTELEELLEQVKSALEEWRDWQSIYHRMIEGEGDNSLWTSTEDNTSGEWKKWYSHIKTLNSEYNKNGIIEDYEDEAVFYLIELEMIASIDNVQKIGKGSVICEIDSGETTVTINSDNGTPAFIGSCAISLSSDKSWTISQAIITALGDTVDFNSTEINIIDIAVDSIKPFHNYEKELSGLNQMIENKVDYKKEQNLTTEEQSTARENIDVPSTSELSATYNYLKDLIDEIPTDYVSYSEEQNLSDSQKNQARLNIETVQGIYDKYEAGSNNKVDVKTGSNNVNIFTYNSQITSTGENADHTSSYRNANLGGASNSIADSGSENANLGGYSNSIADSGYRNANLGGYNNSIADSGSNNANLGGASNSIADSGYQNANLGGYSNSIADSGSENANLGGTNNSIVGAGYEIDEDGNKTTSPNNDQNVIIGGQYNKIESTTRDGHDQNVIVGGDSNTITDASNKVIAGNGISVANAGSESQLYIGENAVQDDDSILVIGCGEMEVVEEIVEVEQDDGTILKSLKHKRIPTENSANALQMRKDGTMQIANSLCLNDLIIRDIQTVSTNAPLTNEGQSLVNLLSAKDDEITSLKAQILQIVNVVEEVADNINALGGKVDLTVIENMKK